MTTPTAPPTSKRSAATAVLYVALALAAFVATSRALAELMPRHVPAVDVKRDHFAAHKDEYTAVYIGTSMIHRHIVPAELPERSFNFGVARMTFAEASVLLDWIVSLRPARLERVVIDAHLFTDSGELNHFSARHIWWHTPRETLGAVQRALRAASWSAGLDVESIQVDIKALLINLTATGRAADAFRLAWDPKHIEPDIDDVPIDADGFRAIEELGDAIHIKRHREYLRTASKLTAEAEQRGAKHRRIGAYEAGRLEQMIERAHAAGLSPLILEGPTFKTPMIFPKSLRQRARVISFNDPEKYHELFTEPYRHDIGHLNANGARWLTRALAPLLTAEGQAPEPK